MKIKILSSALDDLHAGRQFYERQVAASVTPRALRHPNINAGLIETCQIKGS
jgi:hypothetical protein